MRRRRGAGLALLLVLAAPSAPALAQQTFSLGARDDTPLERRLVFDCDATPAARRPGGFGWVAIEAFNPDTSAHEALLTVSDAMSSGESLARTRIRLEPGERARVALPLPLSEWMSELTIEVDGGSSASTRLGNVPSGNTSSLPSFLALTDDAVLGTKIRTSIEGWLPIMLDSGVLTGLATKRVRDLPDRWQMLSGFDAIVLDLRSDGLSVERQQVLADYAAAGGRLILAGDAGTAAAGPLSEMLAAGASAGASAGTPAALAAASAAALAPGSRGRHAFGQWIVALPDERAFGGDVFEWLKEPEVVGTNRSFSGLPRDGLGSYLEIPGVGKVPKSMFLVLIVVFVAVIVYAAFRHVRQRRHGRLLLVVPGTGLAFTGAILVYGFFSEGLGIKGVVRSFTLLDQRSHQAVDVAQRTLYAGLQPDELPLEAGTLLVSWDQSRGNTRERAHRLRLDMNAGWVAGGEALPARLPTHVATVTVSRPRERLRLRRVAPDRLEIVVDTDLRPTGESGALVLCDFEGAWWVSTGEGALRPMDSHEARARLTQSLQGFREFKRSPEPGGDEADERRSFVLRAASSQDDDDQNPGGPAAQHALYEWLSSLVPEELPRGTYVARVVADPCVDDLGLEVDWIEREHVVVGRLAEEDLLE